MFIMSSSVLNSSLKCYRFRAQNDTQIQLVEVTLGNFASSDAPVSSWITSKQTVALHSSSGAIHTVIPGEVKRLRGGDQVRVVVGIVNEDGVTPGTEIDGVQVVINGSPLADQWRIVAGIPDYFVGDESLQTHESPEWFDGAKFGLFVHWGVCVCELFNNFKILMISYLQVSTLSQLGRFLARSMLNGIGTGSTTQLMLPRLFGFITKKFMGRTFFMMTFSLTLPHLFSMQTSLCNLLRTLGPNTM